MLIILSRNDLILSHIYLDEYIQLFSWQKSLSYKNQSIDLHYKLMDWFLYDKDICHERVRCSSLIVLWWKYMS